MEEIFSGGLGVIVDALAVAANGGVAEAE